MQPARSEASRCKSWTGVLLLLSPIPALAGFQNTPVSVKAGSMGGAFVAMADDPSAVFLNPAGLIQLRGPEASLMYGKPLYGVEGLGLEEGYTTLGLPLGKRASMGLGATLFRAAGILSEYQFAGGASLLIAPRLAVGAGAVYLYHSYDIASDPAYSGQPVFGGGNSKGAIGANLGIMALLTPKLQLGLSARNLNRPDVGLKEPDPVPMELRAGSLYRFRHLHLGTEIEQRDDRLGTGRSQTTVWKLGAEIPLKAASFRAGLNSDGLTGGFGLRWGALGLDYAFTLYRSGSASNYGSHLMALSYRLGREPDPNRRLSARARSRETIADPMDPAGRP